MLKNTYGEIQKNLEQIREQIQRLSPDRKVILLCATKTVGVDIINYASDNFGIDCIGENKVQELLDKYEQLNKSKLSIHFIGHLQTNKVKYIIDKVDMIHSVDRISLATEIDKRAGNIGKVMDVLVEVNIASEQNKSGVYPHEVSEFVGEICAFKNLRIKGLMTMAPAGLAESEYEEYFLLAKKLFDSLKSENIHKADMEQLSMGMSDSYIPALRCGATIIRPGSAVFGKRNT